MRPRKLPDFAEPPVTEVVLGVQFRTDERLSAVHVGLYWQLIRESFPNFEEKPFLPPVTDTEDARGIRVRTGPLPLPRCWFMDQSKNRLIQIQPDRFMHNWRRVTGDEQYPRFEAIQNEFDRQWSVFRAFLHDQGLGRPKIEWAELTYVNHIERGQHWREPRDAFRLFSFLADRQDAPFLGTLDRFSASMRCKFPEDKNYLHVSLRPAIRERDQKEILEFILTARGPLPEGEGDTLMGWFGPARERIVKAFADMTTTFAHQCWGRKA